MTLKVARSTEDAKPKNITIEDIEKALSKGKQFFYFDRETEHKDLNKLIEYFEEKDYTVFMKEVKYALGDLDYIYEVHIL